MCARIMTLTRTLETGGVSSYIRNLSKYLSMLGNEICIISTDIRDKKYERSGVKIFVKRINKKQILDIIPLIFFTIPLSKRNKIEIFHANTPVSSLFAHLIKIRNRKMKIIRTVHGNWTNELKTRKNTRELYGGYLIQKILPKISKKIEKFELRRSDYIICVSEELKKYVKSMVHNKRISVISGGVDTDFFYPLKNKRELKKGFGLSNKKTILYVGLINKIKGIESLLKASKEIKDIDFETVIAGTGPDLQYYKKMKNEMNLNNVKFLGFVEDNKMNKLFNSADVFCLPSKWEGLPLTLLEAMSSGLVCIATDVGDIKKVIINNKNGFIVEKNNYNFFIKNLKKTILNSDNIKIKKEAIKTVKELYSYYIISRKINRIYREL